MPHAVQSTPHHVDMPEDAHGSKWLVMTSRDLLSGTRRERRVAEPAARIYSVRPLGAGSPRTLGPSTPYSEL